MRVIFFGSCDLSCMVLSAVQASVHEVVAVVTQPDMPAGRRMLPCPTPVCSAALSGSFPVFKPGKLKNNLAFQKQMQQLKPDALLVASYGRLIPASLLELTDWPLNVHPSPLPLLRGASPVRSALLQGFDKTACCIMRMTPRLDDGDILLRQTLAIKPEWNHGQLELHLGELGGRLAVETLDRAQTGSVSLEKQDHEKATYCGTYTRPDTIIDWSRGAVELHNFIRAWAPDIGAATSLKGRQLKIYRSAVDSPSVAEGTLTAGPGEVAAVNRSAFWVGTGSGLLRVDVLQPENKPRMDSASYLAGNRVEVGMQLGLSVSPAPCV